MSELTIKTNHQWRNFLYRYEVPQDVLESQFDHLDAEEYFDGFIRYRNRYYHLSDFLITHKDMSPTKDWDGIYGTGFFSGVLIKLSKDGERYQIARYLS